MEVFLHMASHSQGSKQRLLHVVAEGFSAARESGSQRTSTFQTSACPIGQSKSQGRVQISGTKTQTLDVGEELQSHTVKLHAVSPWERICRQLAIHHSFWAERSFPSTTQNTLAILSYSDFFTVEPRSPKGENRHQTLNLKYINSGMIAQLDGRRFGGSTEEGAA